MMTTFRQYIGLGRKNKMTFRKQHYKIIVLFGQSEARMKTKERKTFGNSR
jgi:hypothetical protein